jgi:Permuted papain-like amidase enzyme, YaeF/YiiX, C92 family
MKFLPPTRAARIRLGILLIVLAGAAYFSNAQVLLYYLGYTPREGDIVFQSLPRSDLVDAIEGITHSPYSHCGVVVREGNNWVVMESIGDVHSTPLFRWMQRGRGAGIAVYRFDSKYESLLPAFKKNLHTYAGRPYDYDYSMSDSEIYCSELPFKAFRSASGEEMGKLEKLGDLDWKPFESFIKSIQGNLLPLDRVMITPSSLSRAPQIHEIYRQGI